MPFTADCVGLPVMAAPPGLFASARVIEAVDVTGLPTASSTRTRIGGAMAVFTSALDAVNSAIAMQQAVEADNRGREESSRLGLRVGLEAGEPSREEGDYFGMPVIVAERLSKVAEGGQILASQTVRRLVGSRGSHRFNDLVPLSLKGIADPVPAVDHDLVDDKDVAALKAKILASGLSISQLVTTAWASAATFRGSDKRGGANGARIRLAPQKDWEVNGRDGLAKALSALEAVQKDFNKAQSNGKRVSLADVIVLGGCAAVEEAAKKGGHDVKVPFTPGRTDASQDQTDVDAFAPLEPRADGFRNYLGNGLPISAEELLIDRAQLLQPTNRLAGRPVVWMHPAFAGKCTFARNDEKLVCYDLAK